MVPACDRSCVLMIEIGCEGSYGHELSPCILTIQLGGLKRCLVLVV